jgi:predicted lipoprotein with Yx(FWY)xxD motif
MMGSTVRRWPGLLILAVGITALAAGYASSSSASTTASAASGATVKLVHTSKGKILANSRGFTLYMFTADRRNSDRCVKKSGCTSIWPPLTVKGRPTAGTGVRRSLLGTIRLAGGRHQVTYAGHPLYRYSADGGPARTSYIGVSEFGGRWFGVNAAGKPVR